MVCSLIITRANHRRVVFVFAFVLFAHRSRTVSELRFRLQDDDQGNDRGDVVDASWVHAEPIELDPGASHSLTLDMPFDLEVIEAAIPTTDASTSLTERHITGLVAGAARPPEGLMQELVATDL